MAQIIGDDGYAAGEAVRATGSTQATRGTVSEGHMASTLHRLTPIALSVDWVEARRSVVSGAACSAPAYLLMLGDGAAAMPDDWRNPSLQWRMACASVNRAHPTAETVRLSAAWAQLHATLGSDEAPSGGCSVVRVDEGAGQFLDAVLPDGIAPVEVVGDLDDVRVALRDRVDYAPPERHGMRRGAGAP